MDDQSTTVWLRNLAAIEDSSPAVAERLSQTEPAELQWTEARDGGWSASMPIAGARPIALASRYAPLKEAGRLIEQIDFVKQACVAIMGFGVGHHVRMADEKMGRSGVLIVFEPDRALLRAVLSKLDYSDVLGKSRVVLCDNQTDRAFLTGRLERDSALVTQGTQLVSLPVTRQHHSKTIAQFSKALTDTLAFCRTSVATALVNSARTCRNLVCNLDHYVAGSNINELVGAAKGYPAVCVSAGPSLVKNVHLLADPAIREQAVVIAVQTALMPLLDRGIRPDFVTALDYSPICRRFYESLPPLPDVTLVAEPKGHPAILEAYPGPVRVCQSEFNDRLLDTLAKPIVKVKSGATVAHLSLYLAELLGCDPIMLIGQDLGFSDGLYYAPGTAVHRVWAGELNPLNTIEMMEWRRVVRMKGHLQRADDQHGRPIFTDEQMVTYLKQFERDFAESDATIIDASEGGMPKQHTTAMTFAEAIDTHGKGPVPELPTARRHLDTKLLQQVLDLLRQRQEQVRDLRSTTQQTIPILRKMIDAQRDQSRMNTLFKKLNKLQTHVERDLQHAFDMVSNLNTMATFKRQRTDRIIGHEAGDAFDKQRRQIERDIENLDWLIQGCDEALSMIRDGIANVDNSLTQTKTAQTSAA